MVLYGVWRICGDCIGRKEESGRMHTTVCRTGRIAFGLQRSLLLGFIESLLFHAACIIAAVIKASFKYQVLYQSSSFSRPKGIFYDIVMKDSLCYAMLIPTWKRAFCLQPNTMLCSDTTLQKSDSPQTRRRSKVMLPKYYTSD